MRMRSRLKLLKLVKKNPQYFNFGLCHWVDELKDVGVISSFEREILSSYLRNNLPKSREFSAYCWECGKIKPRIQWLDQQIRKLESNWWYKLKRKFKL